MIGYIKGSVLFAKEGSVLLVNNGIGYEIACSAEAYARLTLGGEGTASLRPKKKICF